MKASPGPSTVNAMDDLYVTTQRRVLRARIGVSWPATVDREQLQDRIAAAITAAVDDYGATIDVLQLDLAAHPTWTAHGPTDRITGTTLDQPAPGPGGRVGSGGEQPGRADEDGRR